MAVWELPEVDRTFINQQHREIQERDIMAKFIELTESNGDKVLINEDHILKVGPGDDERWLFLFGGQDFTLVYVKESYSSIKRMSQQ